MELFVPPRLLRSRHVQSVLGSIGLRRRLVHAAARGLITVSRNEIVDCGDGVRLLCQHAPPQSDQRRGVVVFIHGWEGSADSTYLLSAATRLWNSGYRVVRVNLRDHGDSHCLNEELFHSCRLGEVIGAVRWAQQSFSGERLFLCGFSLGGNFSVRIAAQAVEENLGISGVVAVCPVLDPACTMVALDNGLGVYRRYFIRKWRRSLEKKKVAFPHRYNFSQLEHFDTLTEMTDYFVRHYTEYQDLHEYLRGYALTGDRLQGLRTPVRILLAEDDPVIPVKDIGRVAASNCLQVVRSTYGGHCGFIDGYHMQSWADRYIADSIAAQAD